MNDRRNEAGMTELDALPILLLIGMVIAAIALLCMPFIEGVNHGEIVVCESRFHDGTEVWRGPDDPSDTDWRWQGLCKVTEYHDRAGFNFREDVMVGETFYRVRGTVFYDLPKDDAKLLEIHAAYGSEEGIEAKLARPALRASLEAAAADPEWAEPEGGWTKRRLKEGLEYGLKRLSPTGAIWSPHEIQKKLQADLKRRLSDAPSPHGIPMTVELSIVTER